METRENLTIDFFLKNYDDNFFVLCVSDYDNNIVEFQVKNFDRFLIKKSDEYVEENIVECIWNNETKNFKIIKIRFDKIKPNFIESAKNIWFLIKNQ